MKRFYIWGDQIPFNTGKNKYEDMPVIYKDWTMEDVFLSQEGLYGESDTLHTMAVMDTQTYLVEMVTGNCSSHYDDVPYLDAYIVPGAKQCVLNVPGGAYLTVAMKSEGEDVAKVLNEQGISVFVLKYRTYPYKFPVMFADCQRALKWIIGHADDFGYDTDKIAMLGYSAGGHLVGSTYHTFMHEDLLPSDYARDEIDAINPQVNTLAMIYPKLMYDKSSRLLYLLVGLDNMNNPVKKVKAVEKFNLTTKVHSEQVPTFLVNAMDDDVIPAAEALEYALALHKNQVSFEIHSYGRGMHGFGGCEKQTQNPDIDLEGVESWMTLYAIWLKKQNRSEQ